MNYETFIKEGEHLKTLLKLTKLTKEERTSAREDLAHLLDGYIFYPTSTWPPSIKEIVEHNTITDRNTFKLIPFAYGNGISPNVLFPQISLHIHSQYTLKNKETHTPNTLDSHKH